MNGNSLHCDFSSCAAEQCRSHRRAVGCKGSDLSPVKMCQQQGAPTRRELTVHKALSLSLSLCLRLSQGPFGLFPDHQTEICVSYKYITSAGGVWGVVGMEEFRMGAGRRERKKTSYVSSTGKNSFDLTQ